jgi:hypothetical protein
MGEASRDWLRLPVVTAGSECLVMGHLLLRNILTYKAPPGNEGYDLICIHPDPRLLFVSIMNPAQAGRKLDSRNWNPKSSPSRMKSDLK